MRRCTAPRLRAVYLSTFTTEFARKTNFGSHGALCARSVSCAGLLCQWGGACRKAGIRNTYVTLSTPRYAAGDPDIAYFDTIDASDLTLAFMVSGGRFCASRELHSRRSYLAGLVILSTARYEPPPCSPSCITYPSHLHNHHQHHPHHPTDAGCQKLRQLAIETETGAPLGWLLTLILSRPSMLLVLPSQRLMPHICPVCPPYTFEAVHATVRPANVSAIQPFLVPADFGGTRQVFRSRNWLLGQGRHQLPLAIPFYCTMCCAEIMGTSFMRLFRASASSQKMCPPSLLNSCW